MGNCYSDSGAPDTVFDNEGPLTEELRRKMNSFNFNKDIKIRTNEDIFKDYTLVKQLGSGLFSKVYLVTDAEGHKLAMKVIKKKDFQTAETIQKMIIEKEVLKLLDHQNVLKLHRTVQSESRIFFFVEYASKGNLLQLLNLKGRLDINETRYVAAQIYDALYYIHSKGIIYGDLKAENVLIARSGQLKLCDFNLSGTQSILSDTLQGTICYLAPEIVEGKKRTHMSDYWAFGVLVHLLFYRKYPFRCNNQTDLFYNIINRNIDPEPTDIRAPSSLRRFIEDLLTKDVTRRLGRNRDAVMNHPFFSGFDWKNYQRHSSTFRYAEEAEDSDGRTSSASNQPNSDVEDFAKMQLTPTDRVVYNIEGFTYDSVRKDFGAQSEPRRKMKKQDTNDSKTHQLPNPSSHF